MTQLRQRWLFSAALAAACLAPSAHPVAQNLPRFEKSAQCPFTPGEWATTLRLECGYLVVHRIRERPADGTLKIAVAIVHPLEESTGVPLVLPHGGPSGPGGLRGGEMSNAWRLAPLLKRDVIVYDDRGAGLSEPRFATPADRTFVKSDIPTLILTAEFDDRTPTDYGRRIAEHLKRAYIVEMPGLAHGQPHPCQAAIARSFLENPAQPPDTSCLTGMKPLVFETTSLEAVSIVLNIASEGSGSSPFAGVWEGAFPDAPVVYRFEFMTSGKELRGVIKAAVQAFSVFDGRIDEQTLTFKAKTADGNRTITFTGRMDGNRIEFTRDVAVRPGGNPGGAALWGASGARTFTVTRRQ